MPQRLTCSSEPVRTGWNRSAANTPIWQVTEDSTRTVVLIAANGMLSCVGLVRPASGPPTAA